jgi:hypothetical protein
MKRFQVVFSILLFSAVFLVLAEGPVFSVDGPNGKCKGYNETGSTTIQCDESNTCFIDPSCSVETEILTWPNGATLTSVYCACMNGAHTHCCSLYTMTITPPSGPPVVQVVARGDCGLALGCDAGECDMVPVMTPIDMPPLRTASCTLSL